MRDDGLGIFTWRRIAEFIGCEAQTARKYHKLYGMPVYRTPGGVPVAFPEQIKLWMVRFNELKKQKIREINNMEQKAK
jgi:hypothetical protein